MGTENNHRIRVTICGQEYTLRGPASEAHLREVAQLVDAVMQRVAAANPNLDLRRQAVLAALNIADDLVRLQQEYRELLELLDQQTRSSSTR
ncbi:cell division protein ZapA [Alicyclobacillus macrosporangiidus]|uniref:cell division protein ZapA n=1 Tax=Alicyclobacillus macrosporangiidus TaxID=392015 RepID=UPI000497EDCF|nr:cell division protein ZapA [Alicyclobacillus macrosporangiidus]MCL6600854.1 cell division protein ZapA [Alicyclobacillus macrosporangiidus]